MSLKDDVTSTFELDRKPLRIDDDLQAARQTNVIVRAGQEVRCVEIILAPEKLTSGIPSCTEIVYMKIGDCEDYLAVPPSSPV